MSLTNVSRRSAIKLGAGAMALAAGATMMASSNNSIAHAAEAEGGAVFTAPGTYSAEGAGRFGPVTVTMTASADAIESIEITSDETVTIGGYATDILIDQVLSYQSLEFDNVSGATFTTTAFRTALTSCVEQAGGDTSKLAAAITPDPVEYETTSDIIVIGAGGAGLAASLAAAEQGGTVTLIDKAPFVGGNTNAAQSGINVVGSEVLESLGSDGTMEGFIEVQTNELVNPDIVQAFADASGPTADWLAGLGIDFTLSDSSAYQLQAVSDGSMTSNTIVNALKKAIDQQANINLYLNTTVNELVVDDSGTVTGVVATGVNGEDVTFTADAIILATGGFGKNHDLVVEICPDYENTTTDEIAPTTGDGMLWAEDLGAGVVDLDQMQLHSPVSNPYGMITTADIPGGRGTPAGIYVNSDAVRIASEGVLGSHGGGDAQPLFLAQKDGRLYHIFPAEYMTDPIACMIATGFAWQEATVEALADDLGLDGAALAETVNTWNEDLANGGDSEFDRDDIGVVPIEGEVAGFPFQLGVHYCLGGLTFDTTCHVLKTDGTTIPHLYACGECTGGLHGNNRVDGSALSESFTFGHVAGLTASAEVLA